jgi:hypothetical protein
VYYQLSCMASMTTRTVRFDEETEKTLAQIRQATGLSISAVLKQGLLGYHEKDHEHGLGEAVCDLSGTGPRAGGYAIAPASDTRRGVRQAIGRKINR